jgi:predicted tellurium resistance membrane protein TerC
LPARPGGWYTSRTRPERRSMTCVRLACFLAVGLAAGFAHAAEDAKPAAPGEPAVRVRVEKADGTAVEGKLTRTPVRIETAYGTLDLAMDQVRQIEISAEGGDATAVVSMRDSTQVRGKPLFRSLAVVLDNGSIEGLSPAAIRTILVVNTPNTSLLAIVVGLITLTAMEVVLGIDNVIFLVIVAGRLPKDQQPRARKLGLTAALGTRILLLFSLTFLLGLTKPILRVPIPGLDPGVRDISWRDIILLVGGGFLVCKSVWEMHHKLEEARGKKDLSRGEAQPRPAVGFAQTIFQIAVIDIVFSLDSVITAVGMVETVGVMIAAMVIAMLVMMAFAGPIAAFVDRHPTVKMLALSFLILIGVLLVAEGLGQHVSKGYIYFAMAFAVVMELINLRLRPKSGLSRKSNTNAVERSSSTRG